MKRFFVLILTLAILLTLSACYKFDFGHIDPYDVTLPPDFVVERPENDTLPSEIMFDKLVVSEGDSYDIIIKGLRPDAPEGYILNISLSNNTEAREVRKTEYVYETDDDGEKHIVGEKEIVKYEGTTYLFTVDSANVNGKAVDVSFSARLNADERTFDQIVLEKKALESLGTITEIELFFKVYIAKEEDILLYDFSTMVYPYGDPAEEN